MLAQLYDGNYALQIGFRKILPLLDKRKCTILTNNFIHEITVFTKRNNITFIVSPSRRYCLYSDETDETSNMKHFNCSYHFLEDLLTLDPFWGISGLKEPTHNGIDGPNFFKIKFDNFALFLWQFGANVLKINKGASIRYLRVYEVNHNSVGVMMRWIYSMFQ